MLVITFLPGKSLTNETIGGPGVIPRAAVAIRRLRLGPRFVNDFDMFARQAGYLALVREHGFPLPRRVRRVRAAVGTRTPRAGGARPPRRSRATTISSPATSSTTANTSG